MLFNSRNTNLKKPSSLYPESWSEFVCDLNAIEVMMSDKTIIKISDDLKSLELVGHTLEGFKIRIIYDAAHKRIKTHHHLMKELQ